MGYVINDLDPEDKKNNGIANGAPSSTAPAPKAQGIASVVAPQKTAQQQRGTGFTNLSEWLNAGQGRDKAISDTGAQKLGNEKSAFGKAGGTAETGLADNPVINLQGDAGTALDRSAGINPLQGNRAGGAATTAATPPAPPVTPAPPVLTPTSIAGVMGPQTHPQLPNPRGLTLNPGGGGSIAAANSAPHTPPVQGNIVSQPGSFSSGAIPTSQAQTGPTIDQVLDQKYAGPANIDYQAGDDFQSAKMLGNTGTVSDVLGKDAIGQGQYSQGMRALDNVLYGADGAAQNAIKANATNTDAFQKDATSKAGDFATRAQKRSDDMTDAAGKTRQALTKIGDDTKASLDQRAAAANAKAQADSTSTTQVFNPNTGQMENIAPGQVLGGWEGQAAGSATAGNVMTDNESKRFAALHKYLGYAAPTKTGTYQEGRRTTVSAPPPELVQHTSSDKLEAARPALQQIADAIKGGLNAGQLGQGMNIATPTMGALQAVMRGMSAQDIRQLLADAKARYGINIDPKMLGIGA